MAISVDPFTDIIYIPKADLTLVQASPEVRELDLNLFHLWLVDWEDDESNMYRPTTHNHNTEVSLAGLNYARIVEVLSPYTVEFEDGQYTVNCVGANHNLSDRKVANQVSLIVNNAAGLIGNKQIEYSSYDDKVTLDPNSSYDGTLFPVGTPQQPVNNLDDALLIAEYRGFIRIELYDDLVIDDNVNLNGFTIVGRTSDVVIEIDSVASVVDLNIQNATLQNSTLDGGVNISDSYIIDVEYVNGHIGECGLSGVITLGGNKKSVIEECYTMDQDNPPTIDMGGSGNDLAMPNYSGIVTIRNLTDSSNEIGVGLDAGMVSLDSTITAGTIIVSGIGLLVNNAGSGAVVNTDGMLNKELIAAANWEATNTFVCMDDTSAHSGTEWPVGTKKSPVNNLSDALFIASQHGMEKIHIHNNLIITSGEDVSGVTFFADRSLGHAVTVESGAITDDTYFEDLTVSGVMGGSVRYTTCVLGQIDNFDGGAKNCLLTDDITITGNGANYFTDCDTYVTGTNYVNIDIGDHYLNIIRCRGAFQLNNKLGAAKYVVCDFVSASVIIDSSCTEGVLSVNGNVSLTDNSSPGCFVLDGTFTQRGIAEEVWTNDDGLSVLSDLSFIKSIEGGRWQISGNQMIFYSEDNTTELARFDVTYDGSQNPIERVRV